MLTDVHRKNHGTFAAELGINYLLDFVSELAIDNLVKKTDPDLILVLGDTVLTQRNDIETQNFADQMDGYKIPWAPVFGNHAFIHNRQCPYCYRRSCFIGNVDKSMCDLSVAVFMHFYRQYLLKAGCCFNFGYKIDTVFFFNYLDGSVVGVVSVFVFRAFP